MRILMILVLATLAVFWFPAALVEARVETQESQSPLIYNHGMMTGPDCGTHSWVADLTKGRTNSIVVHVHHTVGCQTYDYTNYIGADRARQLTQEETDWQMKECERAGKLDTLAVFDRYWHTMIDESTVQVSCIRYSGPD